MQKLPSGGSRIGFTLIELLVVVAILIILAAILFPTLGAVKQSAKRTQCTSNLRQWGLAMSSYATHNDQRLPFTVHTQGNSAKDDDHPDAWFNALPPLVDARVYSDVYDGSKSDEYPNDHIWWCPVQRDKQGVGGFTGAGNAFDYAMNTVLDGTNSYGPNATGQQQIKLNDVINPAQTLGMSEPTSRREYLTIGGIDPDRHNGKTNLLFLDLHVSLMDSEASNTIHAGSEEELWATHSGKVVWGSFRR